VQLVGFYYNKNKNVIFSWHWGLLPMTTHTATDNLGNRGSALCYKSEGR